MNKHKTTVIQLPATEEELENEIKRQDEAEIPQDPDEVVKFIFTRLAMAELEIDRSLEKGEISEEEAEELRQKYVHGYINSLYDG